MNLVKCTVQAVLFTLAAVPASANESILDRTSELQETAQSAVRGLRGCGTAQVKLLTSRGEVTAETSLDPVHVFGVVIDTQDLLTLLESRAESNRTGKAGPMSGDRGALCYVCIVTLRDAREARAISAFEKLLSDKNKQISNWAAVALFELGDLDPELRPSIRRIRFAADVRQRAADYGVLPPEWLKESE